MDTHPNNAPICYVQPTTDMGIRVSMHVDCNGKIYLPYLHEWTSFASELLVLIQIMIVTFGESPPVFKTTRDSAFKVAYAISPPHQQPDHSGPGAFRPYPSGAAQAAGGGPTPGINFPPYPTAAIGAYPHPVPRQQTPWGGGASGPDNGYVSTKPMSILAPIPYYSTDPIAFPGSIRAFLRSSFKHH